MKTGGPAVARAVSLSPNGEIIFEQEGMDLRDYFAAQALAGWTSNNAIARIAETNGMDLEAAKRTLAEGCYELADAMLAARET